MSPPHLLIRPRNHISLSVCVSVAHRRIDIFVVIDKTMDSLKLNRKIAQLTECIAKTKLAISVVNFIKERSHRSDTMSPIFELR